MAVLAECEEFAFVALAFHSFRNLFFPFALSDIFDRLLELLLFEESLLLLHRIYIASQDGIHPRGDVIDSVEELVCISWCVICHGEVCLFFTGVVLCAGSFVLIT